MQDIKLPFYNICKNILIKTALLVCPVKKKKRKKERKSNKIIAI